MNEQFKYDVFLSHNSQDKPAVRELAERLRCDGLRVWFDEWDIKPGDPILLKIEECLVQSRTLALAMSRNASASEWVTIERHTAMFSLIREKEGTYVGSRSGFSRFMRKRRNF